MIERQLKLLTRLPQNHLCQEYTQLSGFVCPQNSRGCRENILIAHIGYARGLLHGQLVLRLVPQRLNPSD